MWTWQFALLQNVAAINKWTKFISMQNHYSLLYREEEREMIPYCKATGVGLIPWSPLARGRLTRLPASGDQSIRASAEGSGANASAFTDVDKAIIGRVHEIAEKKGWSMATVALALDAMTRVGMQEWLLQVWEQHRKTILFITHDIDEALLLSDRVLVAVHSPVSELRELVIDLPRPRTYEIVMDEAFIALKRQLLAMIGRMNGGLAGGGDR